MWTKTNLDSPSRYFKAVPSKTTFVYEIHRVLGDKCHKIGTLNVKTYVISIVCKGGFALNHLEDLTDFCKTLSGFNGRSKT